MIGGKQKDMIVLRATESPTRGYQGCSTNSGTPRLDGLDLGPCPVLKLVTGRTCQSPPHSPNHLRWHGCRSSRHAQIAGYKCRFKKKKNGMHKTGLTGRRLPAGAYQAGYLSSIFFHSLMISVTRFSDNIGTTAIPVVYEEFQM